MFKELNQKILKQAENITYKVAENAPSDFRSVINQNSELTVWSGESENTIWNDPKVNYAFRALHDALHLETRIGFTPLEEIELGRIQASRYEGILADLVYIEVAEQAKFYMETGDFVPDQVEFTLKKLKGMGYKIPSLSLRS